MDFLLFLLLCAVLFFIIITDIRTHKIPDLLNLAVALLGLISYAVYPDISLASRLWGTFVISLPMLVFAILIPSSFGGGDIKLTAASGFLLGIKGTVVAASAAFILGGLYAALLLFTKKAKCDSHFAFGPAICLGVLISSLFGDDIISLYYQTAV